MTMMIENTRMPRGSRRRLPTGNFLRKRLILHPTSLFVVQTMTVHRRSRAESTNEAINEREEENIAATPLAASKRILAITLICKNVHVSF